MRIPKTAICLSLLSLCLSTFEAEGQGPPPPPPGGGGSGGGTSMGGGTTSTGNSGVRNADPSYGRGNVLNGSTFGSDNRGDEVRKCRGISPPALGGEDLDELDPATCGDGDGGETCEGKEGGGSCSSGTCTPTLNGTGGHDGYYSAYSSGHLWIPNNQANNSSLGPGQYTKFDSQLDFFEETGGNAIGYFDIVAKKNYLFVDGLDGDTLDGEFHDLRNEHARKIELLNGSGSVVSSLSSAVTARVTHWTGAIEEFGLIDLDASTTEEQYAGRLTSRKSREGHELSIVYKTWTQAEIDAAPDRQWQINTVSDDFGNTLTYTYASTQHGGRWAVEKILRQDGVDVDYTYSNDQLASIVYADGSDTIYTYGQDSIAQTATIEIDDALTGKKLTYHVTNDYMTLDDNGQSNVINQPSGVYRMVEDVNEDLLWQMIPADDPADDSRFVYKGGNLGIVEYGDGTFQQAASWGYNTGGGPGGEVTESITMTLDPLVSGVSTSTTTGQLETGQWPGATDMYGREYTFEYDSDGFATKKTYAADSTYEEYAYNSFGQITRERNREGDVIKYTYDSVGNMTSKEVGLEESGGSDVQTASYAKTDYEYYASSHQNANMLKAEKDPLYSSAQSDLHITEYEYDANQRMTKKKESADIASGTRPETTYTYTSSGKVSSVTDPKGRITNFAYDSLGRLTTKTYPDTSTEQTLYGANGTVDEGRVLKTKNRVGTVTSYTYDTAGRVTQMKVGSAIDADILDGNPDDTVISDVNLQNITNYTYLGAAESLKTQVKQNGAKTDYVYNFKNRLDEIKQYPRVSVTLTSKKGYEDDQLLYDEDPYGRRKYYGYRASDGTLIRTVTCTSPSYTLADFAAVWALTRDTSANAQYIVHDAIRDDAGNLTQVIDGRNVETRYEYDAQGREIKKTEAWGSSVAAITETDYDDAGNVTQVRMPRYFDSGDTEGYQKAKEGWTYSGRNLVLTHTEAAGSSVAATESFTYDENGHRETHTDFRGKVWETIDDSCCGKSTASKNPLGHGSIRNADPAGRVAHTATVEDVSSHVANMASPIDAKTLAESTTKYDVLGRTVASTSWLVARGIVDPKDPPIAGTGGVAAADGLTTQYLYDNNLSDGVGLDSTSGVTPLIGSSAITLSNAITKLADTNANGGAGISFNADSPGRASVVINGEGEVSFSISDASGRSVMSGQLDNASGTANALLTWSTQLHDTVTTVTGFGDCLESQSIDAFGKIAKSLTDGAGRTLRAIDQLNKVTTFTYDAAGNLLSIRDPNNVGRDVVYDDLGRAGLTTDTASDTTNSTYDRAGNRVTAIDGNSKSTSYVYDPRGRQKSQTDRLSNTTSFTYLATGQLASLTDAEGQVTTYTYDDAGRKLTEQFPDHTGGSPGDSTYGIVTFTLDEAGRTLRREDQNGDTVTYTYDLAGRLTDRDYRTRANSPSGTIADSDTFTFDDAGRMLTAISGRYSNTVTYTFDTAGRKASEALTYNSQTYTVGYDYDDKGQLTTLTYPDGTDVDRTYTDRGELYQLKYNSTTIDTRTYDDGGRLTGSSYNNGVSESRSYNTDSTLASISYTGASIGNLSYSWDDNKNKTGETITGAMSNYGFSIPAAGYDSEDRLVEFNRTDGNLDQIWSLSEVGDWDSVTTEGTTQTRTHGNSHELLTGGGGTVTHDVKGNITSIPSQLRTSASALALTWDMDNRLRTADVGDDGSVDVTYKFDALGRRIFRDDGTAAVVYVQSGQQTVSDYASGAAASSPDYNYVFASYIDEPVYRDEVGGSDDVYFHHNQQFSVTALTSASGSILERYAYSAYGVPTITNASGTLRATSQYSNRYTYTGREWDEDLSLYHYRARMYDPSLGRFCSKDPIGFEGGINLYAYVENSPLWRMDPSGNAVVGPAVVVVAPLGCYACLTYFHAIGNICANAQPIGQFDRAEVARCMWRELNRMPWHRRASMTLACGTCVWGTAKLIQHVVTKLAPVVRAGVRTVWNKCKNVRCTVRWHTAHHPFPRFGGRRMCHIELQCWIKGVRAAPKKISIPIPDRLCPPRNFDLLKDLF